LQLTTVFSTHTSTARDMHGKTDEHLRQDKCWNASAILCFFMAEHQEPSYCWHYCLLLQLVVACFQCCTATDVACLSDLCAQGRLRHHRLVPAPCAVAETAAAWSSCAVMLAAGLLLPSPGLSFVSCSCHHCQHAAADPLIETLVSRALPCHCCGKQGALQTRPPHLLQRSCLRCCHFAQLQLHGSHARQTRAAVGGRCSHSAMTNAQKEHPVAAAAEASSMGCLAARSSTPGGQMCDTAVLTPYLAEIQSCKCTHGWVHVKSGKVVSIYTAAA